MFLELILTFLGNALTKVGLPLFSQRVVDLAHLVAAKWPGSETTTSGDPLDAFCKTNPETDE